MESQDNGKRHLLLPDLLQQLGSEAKDAFVKRLKSARSLKAARQVCTSMRDLVDSSIREICLTLAEASRDMWQIGTRPPLQRWSRCTHVALIVRAQDDAQAGSFLALPFVKLPPEARLRITSLELVWNPPLRSAAAVSMVLLMLPSLQRVALCRGLPDGRPEQQLLFGALASLPHLEKLTLPCSRILHGVGAVAGSLRTLIVDARDCNLDAPMAAAIGLLHRLEQLTVHALNVPNHLPALLRAVPPSLRLLELMHGSGVLGGCRMLLHLDAGRISSVVAHPYDVPLSDLLSFAELLLSTGAVGPRLKRLQLPGLDVSVEGDVERALGGPEQTPLQALLRRSKRLKLDYVAFGLEIPLEVASKVLAFLGSAVRDMRLNIWEDGFLLVRLRAPGALLAQEAQAAGEQPVPLPPAPSLPDLAFQRMMATGAAPAGTAGACCSTASTNAAGTAQGMGLSRSRPLLLLRCPLPSGPEPQRSRMCAWVQQLGKQALQAASLVDEGHMPSSHLLSSADSVFMLVQCPTAAALSVAEGVARLVAAAAAIGGRNAAAAQLQLTSNVYTPPAGVAGNANKMLCQLYFRALEQAAQSVLDGEGFAASWSEGQRLRWLLEQWVQIRDTPPDVEYVLSMK